MQQLALLADLSCVVQMLLAEKQECPFTKQPLTWATITLLTKSNFERFEDKIRED